MLPTVITVMCVTTPPELIAFATRNKNHANGHQRWRHDKNQNPTAQGLNHSGPGRGRPGIAKRATLGDRRDGRGKYEESNQRHTNKKERSLNPHSCKHLWPLTLPLGFSIHGSFRKW